MPKPFSFEASFAETPTLWNISASKRQAMGQPIDLSLCESSKSSSPKKKRVGSSPTSRRVCARNRGAQPVMKVIFLDPSWGTAEAGAPGYS